MTRSDLVQQLAREANISIKESDRIVRVFTEMIINALASGEKITLSGFGTFERRLRSATMARNPVTHEPMRVREQYVAAFRAGTALKEAVKFNAK